MNIVIVTWYKAINHGAVLQAYASVNYLKSYGFQPLLLDYDREPVPPKGVFPSLSRKLKKLTPYGIDTKVNSKQFNIQKKSMFSDFTHTHFSTIQLENVKEEDILYIGSDMIFDFTEGYNPFSYGIGIKSKYKFAYSPSFGYATEDEFNHFEKRDEIARAICALDATSYRDNNTGEMLKQISPRNLACKTLDPVLLYGFEREKKDWDTGKWAKHSRYILVYSYTFDMDSQEERDYITNLAQTMGATTVSVGYYHCWCKENVNAGIEEFFEMVKHAEAVVTDTFHGTVFSILLRKSFKVIIRRNAFKIRDLLSDLRLLDDVCITDLESDQKDLLSFDIDFFQAEEKLELARKRSIAYVEQQLRNARQKIVE